MAEDRGDAGRSEGRRTGRYVGDDAVHVQLRIGDVQAGQFAEDCQYPRKQNAPEDVAADTADHEEGRKQDAQHSQQYRNAYGVEGAVGDGLLKGKEGNLRSRVGDDDLGVEQADEGDKQTDAGGHCLFSGSSVWR